MVPMPLKDALFKKLAELEQATLDHSQPLYKLRGSDIVVPDALEKWQKIHDAIFQLKALIRKYL